MINPTLLANPNGRLLAEIEARLFLAYKNKPLWAKMIQSKQTIETLEGPIIAEAGDYLCRGIDSELWPQNRAKILEKYLETTVFDDQGWQRFDPRPNIPPIQVAQVATPFHVNANAGKMVGKAFDYVARSLSDPEDIWIVDRAIFEASYEIRPLF